MKNKIIIFLILILFFNLINLAVIGQTREATSSPEKTTPLVDEKKIQEFKEKVASKVAELTKKTQKAITGFVVKTGDKQLVIKSEDNKEYQIQIDDILTKVYRFSGGQKKEIPVSEVKKDDYLIVSGPVSGTLITANYIFIDENFVINVGKVIEIDKENYTLKVLTSDKESITLDIEADTKRLMLDIKTLELVKIGFSKIKEGDTIHFVIKRQANKEQTRFSAIKVLIVPQEYFIK